MTEKDEKQEKSLNDIVIQLNNIYLELDRLNRKRVYALPIVISILTGVLVSIVTLSYLIK